MFVAKNRQSQLINVLEGRIEKGQEFFCPSCQSALRLKEGRVKQTHFAHISLQDCHFQWENESTQHLSLKAAIYAWARQHHAVQVEAYIPEIEQVADILLEKKLALEVQCSSLSISRLKERTLDYRQTGLQVLWLLGRNLWLKDHLNALQKQFLNFSQNMGFFLWELDDEKQELRLRYLIHEDWRGKVYCLTKSFPFGQGNLLDILRLPYGKQSLSKFDVQMDNQLCHFIRKQLYYQVPKWMKMQAEAYKVGENLLTKSMDDFYPQVRPPQSEIGFVQLECDVADFQERFLQYYEQVCDKKRQVVYAPAFYLRWCQSN